MGNEKTRGLIANRVVPDTGTRVFTMVSGPKFEHKNIATLPHACPAGKGPIGVPCWGREVILRARTMPIDDFVTVTHVIFVTEPRLTKKKEARSGPGSSWYNFVEYSLDPNMAISHLSTESTPGTI